MPVIKRNPTKSKPPPPPPPPPSKEEKEREEYLILAEQNPYCPSFKIAFRLLLLPRLLSAAYSFIPSFVEVYSYWEPIHLLSQGWGFISWDYAPSLALRSWSFVYPYSLIGRVVYLILDNKLQTFYALRVILALFCTLCETIFYRATVEHVSPRVGRYLLFGLLTSSAMYQASVAFLPNTFAMCTTMLAMSFIFRGPLNFHSPYVFKAMFWLAIGAGFGWPFSSLVGIPFVLEELFLYGREISEKVIISWRRKRLVRLLFASGFCLLVLAPVWLTDAWYYDRFTIVPLNNLRFNYSFQVNGFTEPWWFYFHNGFLNFNFLWLLSLICLPVLSVTTLFNVVQEGDGRVTPTWVILAFRSLPVYVWLIAFTLHPEKEERFLYVIYPLVCFNGALCLYALRGMAEKLLVALQPTMKISQRRSLLKTLTFFTWILIAFFSVMRGYNLFEMHHHSLEIYQEATKIWQKSSLNATLCLGNEEWKNYPSSFFIPKGIILKFLDSPKWRDLDYILYSETDKPLTNTKIEDCDYLINSSMSKWKYLVEDWEKILCSSKQEDHCLLKRVIIK